MTDHSDHVDFERRIARALDRIGAGLATLRPAGEGATAEPEAGAAAELARLSEELAAERDANAQMSERLRQLREKQEAVVPDLERRLEALTAQIDAQGVEVQRLKMTNVQLRETIQALHEAMGRDLADPSLVNKGMAAELEALRAARSAEIAELDGILGALKPLIPEGTDA